MNGDKKNNHHEKKGESLEEPKMIYSPEENPVISSDSEMINPILEKLISKGIQDCNEGKGIPHDEMMRRVKEKYPFLK